MPETSPIQAVAFDCFGTLVEFGDDQFAEAYGEICRSQGLALEGKAFYDKWMEVWRRLAQEGRTSDTGTVAVTAGSSKASTQSHLNVPGPLSEAEPVPPHPEHHTPSAGRHRSLDGPVPPFRPYSDEWPEHFGICFEELGAKGDARAAYEQLIEIIGRARAFPESRRVVETLSRRLPVALMSNADDNFLLPALARNGLAFAVTLSSEQARAYKPHVAIFEELSRAIGVPRANIVYVGDSRFADITGAKNAGMHAVWLNRKGQRPLEQAAQDAARSDGGEAGRQPQRPQEPPDFEIESLDSLVEILAG